MHRTSIIIQACLKITLLFKETHKPNNQKVEKQIVNEDLTDIG